VVSATVAAGSPRSEPLNEAPRHRGTCRPVPEVPRCGGHRFAVRGEAQQRRGACHQLADLHAP